MFTEITSGIKVSVETFYQPTQSHPLQSHYFFAYRITIRNDSDYTVQLKRRHWFIFDSNGTRTEVEGEGVVGEQPVLQPGEEHKYISGCNLTTDIGSMHGTYLMEREMDQKSFRVRIPKFEMIFPFRLN